MKLAAKIVIWLIALLYSYGAAVHVFNILDFSGFDWSAAPLKWQVLDMLYLGIDFLVVVGLVLGWRIGFAAFYFAAISQIFLYTKLRDWIVDVPPGFTVSEVQQGCLTAFVIFHCMTVILFTSALWIRSKPVQ